MSSLDQVLQIIVFLQLLVSDIRPPTLPTSLVLPVLLLLVCLTAHLSLIRPQETTHHCLTTHSRNDVDTIFSTDKPGDRRQIPNLPIPSENREPSPCKKSGKEVKNVTPACYSSQTRFFNFYVLLNCPTRLIDTAALRNNKETLSIARSCRHRRDGTHVRRGHMCNV